MNWLGIAENVAAALLSALAIGVIAWAISWGRNLLLERKLRESINPNGVGVEFDPTRNQGVFSVQVHNYANATIRVRAVVLVADRGRLELKPALNKPIYQTPLSNEIGRPTFRRSHLSKGSLEPDDNPNAMLLPPKTMGIWEIRTETFTSREWIVEKVFVVFEYATIFGNAALIRMAVADPILRLIKENFEPLVRTVHRNEPFDVMHRLRRAREKV